MGKPLKVPKPYFKMVEFELFNYDETKKQLAELEEELYDVTAMRPFDAINVQTNKTGNPTEVSAIKLMSRSSVSIARMERTVRAIDRALVQLDETHNEIFELKYRQGKNYRQVLSDGCFAQDTYFRKRRELIQAVALQMGLTD